MKCKVSIADVIDVIKFIIKIAPIVIELLQSFSDDEKEQVLTNVRTYLAAK